MKKLTLFAAILVVLTGVAHAQKAAEYYNKGKFLSDKANEHLKSMGVFNKIDNIKIIEQFKSASENYLNAEKEMPGTRYLARYNAANDLYMAATRHVAANELPQAFEALKSANELWPELKSLPEAAVTREKTIVKNGLIFTFPAATTAEGRKKVYFDLKYLTAKVAGSLGKQEEALENYREIADHAEDLHDIVWISAYYVAINEKHAKQLCEGAKYAVRCIESASRIQPKEEDLGIEADNAMIEEMTIYLVEADSSGCEKIGMMDKAIVGLAAMSGKWTQKASYAYALGEKLYNSGIHSFDLLYNEYKLARIHNDPEISEKWRLRLVENGRYFSSVQWKTLADYYYTLSFTEARTDALENAKKKERKENTFYFVAIEPTCIPLGQYAASIGFVGIEASHEFRFGFIPSGIKPFLKSGVDSEKVPLYIMTHYTGFQASYSFKIITKGEVKNSYTYVGGEFRYTARNYTDSLTYYNKEAITEKHKDLIAPHAAVYDACLIFGGITRGKYIYTDIFGGVGIGYKTINYNIDLGHYAVANAPFKADMWNKFYVPVRVGLKIGLVL
jgi:hypothetical protein